MSTRPGTRKHQTPFGRAVSALGRAWPPVASMVAVGDRITAVGQVGGVDTLTTVGEKATVTTRVPQPLVSATLQGALGHLPHHRPGPAAQRRATDEDHRIVSQSTTAYARDRHGAATPGPDAKSIPMPSDGNVQVSPNR